MGRRQKPSKIITALRDRRRIEEAIRRLAHLSVPREPEREAQRIAEMGLQVVPALTGLLDTSDPRLLGVLGLVARHLDRRKIVLALQGVATWSAQSDRARLAAMLILERFLGEQLDESWYAGLQSPEKTVAQSLVEMVTQATHNRDILREYVRAAEQQPDDVLELVFSITANLEPEQAALPLWALAQSAQRSIAEPALHRLGSLRSPASGVMLQTLLPTLSPTRRPLAERSLRKLRFSGVEIPSLHPPHPAWRALVSAIDGQGSQSVWFLFEPQQDAPVGVLGVLLNDLIGIQNAICDHEGELAQRLPSERQLGRVQWVVFPGAAGASPLLETTFETGRHLVREALAVNHARERFPPLRYAVLSDALWKWEGDPQAGWPQVNLSSVAEVTALRAHTAELLDHPAFDTWFLRSEALSHALRRLEWATVFRQPLEQSAWLDELTRRCFSPEVTAHYGNRLEKMAGWLWLAGEVDVARLAMAAAVTLRQTAPEGHPLARRMVKRGVTLALRETASTLGPQRRGFDTEN
jgi:hypothetical protein